MNPVRCDVAVVIYSRSREGCLGRLLADLHHRLGPVLREGGLSYCVFVYAQGYRQAFVEGLARTFADQVLSQEMILLAAAATHRTIGEVAQTAIRLLHERCDYKLAMLMDDDSVFSRDLAVDANLQRAARDFIAHRHRGYSVKFGESRVLDYRPFLHPEAPIMPFREKMLWVSRAVLDEVLVTPRFEELSIGEDAVIAAIAWLGGRNACFGIGGMATFLHLGYERPDEPGSEGPGGGYAELIGETMPGAPEASTSKYEPALRRGVTPHDVMPAIFVGRDHPLFDYNGVRPELVAATGEDR